MSEGMGRLGNLGRVAGIQVQQRGVLGLVGTGAIVGGGDMVPHD